MSGDPQEPMDDSDRLKPCPFCGSAAEMDFVRSETEDPPDEGGYFISCGECGASTNLRFPCGEDPRPLLIEQWNRRQGEIALSIKTEEHDRCSEDIQQLRAAVIGLLEIETERIKTGSFKPNREAQRRIDAAWDAL